MIYQTLPFKFEIKLKIKYYKILVSNRLFYSNHFNKSASIFLSITKIKKKYQNFLKI